MIEKLNNKITLLNGEVKLLQSDKEIDQLFDKNRNGELSIATCDMHMTCIWYAAYRMMHMTC